MPVGLEQPMTSIAVSTILMQQPILSWLDATATQKRVPVGLMLTIPPPYMLFRLPKEVLP